MSPERPSSAQSESAVARMSVPASPIAHSPSHTAQSPISILLAVAQSQKGPDDDLTSLSWLHEGDVLKDMIINTSPLNSSTSTPIKAGTPSTDASPTSDYVDDSSTGTSASGSSTSSALSSPNSRQPNQQQSQQQQPQNQQVNLNVPYDPHIHVTSKPPYSFSSLIFMAIEDSKQKALPVKDIYMWIMRHFPYFETASTGWKNSVRHNLSLNKSFRRVDKAPNLGKGSLWTVAPQSKPGLLQTLNRSPFHRCSPVDTSSYAYYASPKGGNATPAKDDQRPALASRNGPNLPNPDLFPYLSRKLASAVDRVKTEREESLDAADAAAVMLSLKNGGRIKQQDMRSIINSAMIQDHTYSAADNCEDEAFESDEDKRGLRVRRKIDFKGEIDDEQRRIKEGAETLLNLAGIATCKRSSPLTLDLMPQPKMARFAPEEGVGVNEDQKSAPFRPRLLRTKRKENDTPKKVFNNNQDEWLKHRRELDLEQSAR